MKTHTNLPHSAVLLGALVLGFAPVLASAKNATYYVKPDGNDSASGTSWDTAFATPAKGFSMANTGGGQEDHWGNTILIAPGTYQLTDAIGCSGGYAESQRTRFLGARIEDNSPTDPEEVVLRGVGDREVLRLAYSVTVANLTIENGQNRSSCKAAGVRVGGNATASSTLSIVSNCIVRSCNNAYGNNVYGGPVVVYSDGLLVDSVVSNNTAVWRGSGVTLAGPDALALRCVITGNDATSADNGGATVMGCSMASNGNLGASGGGQIVDCVVTNNTGSLFAGAFNVPKVSGCLFEGNEASTSFSNSRGGGLFVNAGVAEITNCIFRGNKAYFGGGAFVSGIPATISDCLFEDNSVFGGGGGACVEGAANAVVEGCRFLGNVTTGGDASASNNEWGGGGLFLRSQTTASWCSVSNCVFGGNSTQCRGGAFAHTWRGTCQAEIVNSVFTNNVSMRQGGAIVVREDDSRHDTNVASIRNCLVANNRTMLSSGDSNGGGIHFVTYNPVSIENCTIVSNVTAYSVSGGVHNRYGGRLVNCIVAFNKHNGGARDDAAAGATAWSCAEATYLNCCSYPNMPSHLTAANGCKNEDPKFTDAANGDFTLKRGSPCRNAGTATGLSWMEGAFDLSGAVARISESKPDIGCYEVPETFKHTILFFN